MRNTSMILVLLLLMPTLTAVAEGGVNEASPLEGTDISILHISPQEPQANVAYPIWLNLSEEADQNGTIVEWVTQICINSGVCYPPATQSLERDESGNWFGEIIPDDSASYINWRFVLHYEDQSEVTIPETGWGWKVWSSCWYDNGTWGGSTWNDNGDDCQSDEDGLPGPTAPLAALSLTMAALMARRD
ncbi:MAG: hypothetical protein CMA70_04410 [Euryarchaeota archaeon]|nr:hypothetical protein [Euryarchaeota archaeon]